MDHILNYMIKNKIPLTRRNYLDLAYWNADYEPDAEEESMLPEMFQKYDADGNRVITSEHVN